VNEHRIVYRLDQALKQLFTAIQVGAALFQGFEQFIDRRAQLFEGFGLTLEYDPSGGSGLEGQSPDLFRELADGALLPPIPNDEHTDAHG
jgi:hypothetical protein